MRGKKDLRWPRLHGDGTPVRYVTYQTRHFFARDDEELLKVSASLQLSKEFLHTWCVQRGIVALRDALERADVFAVRNKVVRDLGATLDVAEPTE